MNWIWLTIRIGVVGEPLWLRNWTSEFRKSWSELFPLSLFKFIEVVPFVDCFCLSVQSDSLSKTSQFSNIRLWSTLFPSGLKGSQVVLWWKGGLFSARTQWNFLNALQNPTCGHPFGCGPSDFKNSEKIIFLNIILVKFAHLSVLARYGYLFMRNCVILQCLNDNRSSDFAWISIN